MRLGLIAIVVGAALVIGVARAQDAEKKPETKTSAKPERPLERENEADRIWNFHFHGKKKRGTFIELLQPEEGKGRILVLTRLDVRMRNTMKYQVVEHRKAKKRRSAGGGMYWKKFVRRCDLFSFGGIDATTRSMMASGFSTLTGMKFEPDVRPALEITQGGGELAVYAEGYWIRP